MDGHFVDNISFGSAFVEAVGRHTNLPLDVHLMITRPDHYLPRFTSIAASITSHVEADHDVAATLGRVREAGCKAGLAVSPPTDIASIEPFLGHFDILLIMTVNPGFGGQSYIATMEPKIREVRDMLDARGYADTVDVEVDGGIGPATIAGAVTAGANVLIAGSALYADPEGLTHAVSDLRARAEAARAEG